MNASKLTTGLKMYA